MPADEVKIPLCSNAIDTRTSTSDALQRQTTVLADLATRLNTHGRLRLVCQSAQSREGEPFTPALLPPERRGPSFVLPAEGRVRVSTLKLRSRTSLGGGGVTRRDPHAAASRSDRPSAQSLGRFHLRYCRRRARIIAAHP